MPQRAGFQFGLLCCLAVLSGCQSGSLPGAQGARVSVAAASDLKFAFDEVVLAFRQQHPRVEVETTYGSSGAFFAQLSQRAPFDLYLSADIEYPRKLSAAGMTAPDSEFRYALGQIVVWVRRESSLAVEERGLEALLDPTVRRIAIANPQHAPYGRAAKAALEKAGLYEKVASRLVLGENIAQTAQFVESGAADVGVIALSLAMAPAMKDQGRYYVVPRDAYPPLEQGGVILGWAADREAAAALRAFLIGPDGRAILARYGFVLPE